jgi:hypothetical protein
MSSIAFYGNPIVINMERGHEHKQQSKIGMANFYGIWFLFYRNLKSGNYIVTITIYEKNTLFYISSFFKYGFFPTKNGFI